MNIAKTQGVASFTLSRSIKDSNHGNKHNYFWGWMTPVIAATWLLVITAVKQCMLLIDDAKSAFHPFTTNQQVGNVCFHVSWNIVLMGCTCLRIIVTLWNIFFTSISEAIQQVVPLPAKFVRLMSRLQLQLWGVINKKKSQFTCSGSCFFGITSSSITKVPHNKIR